MPFSVNYIENNLIPQLGMSVPTIDVSDPTNTLCKYYNIWYLPILDF